jgi:hypothetical protein
VHSERIAIPEKNRWPVLANEGGERLTDSGETLRLEHKRTAKRYQTAAEETTYGWQRSRAVDASTTVAKITPSMRTRVALLN